MNVANKLSATLKNTSIQIYLGKKENVAYFQRYFTAQTGRNLGPEHIWMTTGFVGNVIALKTCDSIYIYGAVSKQDCDSGVISKQVPYHYYGSLNKKLCKYMSTKPYGHSFFDEHQIYDDWSKQRKIELLHT